MKHSIRILMFSTAMVGLGSTATAAEMLVNGGFELPEVSQPCCVTAPPTVIPGWVVEAGDTNVVNGTYNASPSGANLAFEGDQYLDLVGESGAGQLSQTFATVAGQSYQLSFAYSHNIFTTPTASALFSVAGLTGAIAHSGGTASDLAWLTYTGRFTATGSNAILRFTNTAGAPAGGIFLDAVSVGAVPEPSVWAMLILGFGVVGGAMRAAPRVRKYALS